MHLADIVQFMNLDGSSSTDLHGDLFDGQLDFTGVKQESSFLADDELGLDNFDIINYTSEPPPLISEASLNSSVTDIGLSVASPLPQQLPTPAPAMVTPAVVQIKKPTSVLQHHLLEAEVQIRNSKVSTVQHTNPAKVQLRPPRAPRPLQPHLHSQLAQHLTAPLSPPQTPPQSTAPAVQQQQPLVTEVLLQTKPPQQLQVTSKTVQQKLIMQPVAQVSAAPQPAPLQPAAVPQQVIISTQSNVSPVNLQQLQQVQMQMKWFQGCSTWIWRHKIIIFIRVDSFK